MSYQQNLPTYTHKFLSYEGWIILESPHYIFYFTAGSEAEKDIEIIKNTQEAAFEKNNYNTHCPYTRYKDSVLSLPRPRN